MKNSHLIYIVCRAISCCGGDNMDYYNSIKELLIDNELTKRAKDYSKNKSEVYTYYNVGKLLKEAGKCYGDNIIGEYSNKLVVEVGKKYNKRTLFRMRQLYSLFSNTKVSTMWTQLTWSHLRLLFNIEIESINYYILSTVSNHLSVRELEKRIKNKEYERLPLETKSAY